MLNEDYMELLDDAKWEVFENEMEKREWREDNAGLVDMFLSFNSMKDEDFKVEVASWSGEDIKNILKYLRNCDELMRVIDLLD
jgi:spore coat protein CotH